MALCDRCGDNKSSIMGVGNNMWHISEAFGNLCHECYLQWLKEQKTDPTYKDIMDKLDKIIELLGNIYYA